MQREQEYLTPSAEPAGNGPFSSCFGPGAADQADQTEMPPAKAWVSF